MKINQKILWVIPPVLMAGVIAASFPHRTSAEFDIQGVNQQLQNHEARITNNENDIKALQDNTTTPPADNHVAVPAAPTQAATDATPAPSAPQPTPQPAEPTVVSQRYYCHTVDGQNVNYRDDTYSDGHVVINNMGAGVCISN